MVALEGVAGAGKTTALSAVRDAQSAGYQVEGFAPTSVQPRLGEAGIASNYVQRHLTRTEGRMRGRSGCSCSTNRVWRAQGR